MRHHTQLTSRRSRLRASKSPARYCENIDGAPRQSFASHQPCAAPEPLDREAPPSPRPFPEGKVRQNRDLGKGALSQREIRGPHGARSGRTHGVIPARNAARHAKKALISRHITHKGTKQARSAPLPLSATGTQGAVLPSISFLLHFCPENGARRDTRMPAGKTETISSMRRVSGARRKERGPRQCAVPVAKR